MISSLEQRLHGGKEVVLNRAAKAAVVQFHQTVFNLLFWTEATTPNQIAIQTNTAKLVHHHSQALATVD